MLEPECACCGKRTNAGRPGRGEPRRRSTGRGLAALAAYLWHGQFLSRDRARAALGRDVRLRPSPAVISRRREEDRRLISPAIDAIVKALHRSEVAHFDETGFRSPGRWPGCTRPQPETTC